MPNHFLEKVRRFHEIGASLAAIEAIQEGEAVQLVYHFLLEGRSERLTFPGTGLQFPSLIQVYGCADYVERALYRRYRIKFVGNPNLELGL